MSEWTTVVVAALTAGGTVGVARAARRSPRQERRDDFALITSSLRQDLTDVKAELAAQKTEQAAIKRRADGADELTRWLVRWFRACVGVMHESNLEIPPRPQPEPPTAAEHLHDIGV